MDSVQIATPTHLLDEVWKPKEEETTAFGWHFDSVPFVCVTMLSDCKGMVGGETAIKTGRGTQMKIRGPTMVSDSISP